MGRLKPYTGTSLGRLVLEINKNNELHLVHGVDFELSSPVAVSGTDGRNTKVTFTPLVFNRGFKEQDLSYKRLDLSIIGNLPTGAVLPVFIETLPTTTHAILDKINGALGLDLIKDEVEDTSYPPEILSGSYTLTIVEGASYGWLGSYDFSVEVDNKLSNVILYPALGMIADPLLSPEGEYDPELEILKLISDANPGVHFDPGSLIFSNVEDIGTSTDGFILSQVHIEAEPISGYHGSVLATYSRRSLEVLGSDLSITSEVPITKEMAHELLTDTTADTNLELSDLVSFSPVGEDIGDIGDIPVRASVTSLAWGGSVKIAYLFGLPANIGNFHICVNQTLPSQGYLF